MKIGFSINFFQTILTFKTKLVGENTEFREGEEIEIYCKSLIENEAGCPLSEIAKIGNHS